MAVKAMLPSAAFLTVSVTSLSSSEVRVKEKSPALSVSPVSTLVPVMVSWPVALYSLVTVTASAAAPVMPSPAKGASTK